MLENKLHVMRDSLEIPMIKINCKCSAIVSFTFKQEQTYRHCNESDAIKCNCTYKNKEVEVDSCRINFLMQF